MLITMIIYYFEFETETIVITSNTEHSGVCIYEQTNMDVVTDWIPSIFFGHDEFYASVITNELNSKTKLKVQLTSVVYNVRLSGQLLILSPNGNEQWLDYYSEKVNDDFTTMYNRSYITAANHKISQFNLDLTITNELSQDAIKAWITGQELSGSAKGEFALFPNDGPILMNVNDCLDWNNVWSIDSVYSSFLPSTTIYINTTQRFCTNLNILLKSIWVEVQTMILIIKDSNIIVPFSCTKIDSKPMFRKLFESFVAVLSTTFVFAWILSRLHILILKSFSTYDELESFKSFYTKMKDDYKLLIND
jgi:hypothetical protein